MQLVYKRQFLYYFAYLKSKVNSGSQTFLITNFRKVKNFFKVQKPAPPNFFQ